MSILWGYISILLLMIAFACHQYILAIAILVFEFYQPIICYVHLVKINTL